MKVICDGNDLAEAVGKASKALGQKTVNQILEYIKIDATPGTLTLTATDNELTIETSIVADVVSEGSILVPGKLFSDFTRKLTNERIELLLASNKLVVKYSDSAGEIACASADEYPEMREMSEAQSFTIIKKEFKDLISKVAFSASVDSARPILKGVLLDVDESFITAVALDSYRLAKCVKTLEKTSALMHAVVPARCLSEIGKMLDDSEDPICAYIQRGSFRMDLGHTTVTSILLDGDFVNYRGLVPTAFETTVTLPCEPFSDGLERAILLSKGDKSNPVRFDINERLLVISSMSEAGNLNEKIPIVMTGPDLAIAFNAKYFTEMLRVLSMDTITVKFNTPSAPCVVEPAGGSDDFLYLILPVRLN